MSRRYYANGELAEEALYVEGVIAERVYLRPTDPAIRAAGHLPSCTPEVVRQVTRYEEGDRVGHQYFGTDGRELTKRGEPVGARPPNIPPTCTYENLHWCWARWRGEEGTELLETRSYDDAGRLRAHTDHRTGATRGYFSDGSLAYEGQRGTSGTARPAIGTWRFHDTTGALRREEQFDDEGHLRGVRWHRLAPPGSREGPSVGFFETGVWTVRDAHGEVVLEVDVGSYLDDVGLLAHPVAADELDPAYQPAPRDRGLAATLARVRRGDPADPAMIAGGPWHDLQEGQQVSLAASAGRWRMTIPTLLHAIRWGPPDARVLADLAAALFRGARIAAALDVIDAAIALDPDPAWQRQRRSYLSGLGRLDEIARPDDLDERTWVLLEEIRRTPDDDAPRLVLADHLAMRFPAHAALIVAQCQGRDTPEVLAAFRASVPWAGDITPVRGFAEVLAPIEASVFLAHDLEAYRIAPCVTRLELAHASLHLAELATLPSLRRYRALRFVSTTLIDNALSHLAGSRHLDDLTHLDLRGCGIGDADLEALARATAFPHLGGLDLGQVDDANDYTLHGLRTLAGAPFARTLRTLALPGAWLGDEVVEVVARFPALVELDLEANRLTDLGALVLADLPLASVRVGGNAFTDLGRDALRARFGARVRW